MADSTTATRKSRRAAANDTEDSVEAEFGGDYSEASLEVIRQLGRKGAQFGQVEPWEQQAVQPPAQEECDAAVEELTSLERTLEAARRYKPDAKELAWIDYKRSLVEDASDAEITWLKLKAYQHGMDALRASYARDAKARDALEASSGSREEGPARASEVAAARSVVLRAARALLPSSSGSEEDVIPGPRRASHAQASASGGRAAAAFAPTMATAAAAAPSTATTGGTIYTPEYLEEITLSRQLAQQRHQRSTAFLLGLAAAVGVSVARWWMRRRRNGGSAAGRRPAAAPQPQPVPQ